VTILRVLGDRLPNIVILHGELWVSSSQSCGASLAKDPDAMRGTWYGVPSQSPKGLRVGVGESSLNSTQMV